MAGGGTIWEVEKHGGLGCHSPHGAGSVAAARRRRHDNNAHAQHLFLLLVSAAAAQLLDSSKFEVVLQPY
jgi:hypothetical protein